ncbi:MAG: N-formylglutamate amidohydrolase [Acidocella sp.]|nr:N-formylglutamate amidohydrolase [Acidocella sp.]
MNPQDGTLMFTLRLPPANRVPVVLTSPHSGRRYRQDFLALSRLDAIAIRRSEDSFVEELFASGPDVGMPLLAANFPRAYCDVNREAWELDPTMFEDELPDYVNTASPRVHAGLGTIARIVGTGEPIYAAKLRFADAKHRIERCWNPYHAALSALIDETRAMFGVCLVIDCHSMPTMPGRSITRPDVVLGDGFGTSCAPAMTDFFQTSLISLGMNVRRNDPYAGGYITRHYGCPRDGVHVVQMEVARALYMNERNFTRNAQFSSTQRDLEAFLRAVAKASFLWADSGPSERRAAE